MERRLTAMRWLAWEYHEMPPETVAEVSDADNLAYAKAIVICAAGDGEISPKEREWIVGYLTSVGDPDEVLDVVKTYDGGDSIEALVETSPLMRAAGRSLIYDALRACASDGELSDGERDRVNAAADRLGIPREVVGELEQIVRDEEALRKRRHKLIVADAFAALAENN